MYTFSLWIQVILPLAKPCGIDHKWWLGTAGGIRGGLGREDKHWVLVLFQHLGEDLIERQRIFPTSDDRNQTQDLDFMERW